MRCGFQQNTLVRFIASFQVSSSIHKNMFYIKRKVIRQPFFLCIIKAYRIRHASSHCAFFITCNIYINKTFKKKHLAG